VPKEAHGLAANALLGPISGLGSLGAATLLGRAFTRPDRRLKLVLIAGEDANTLYGMKATGSSSDGKENEKPQLMLGAKQVHLTRQA
jgi:hypothetical protein